jgi:ankyrin repeat protein
MLAAQRGSTEVVERLCARPGVQVDQPHPFNQSTALHYAARDNHVPAMQVLLESGAAVDALSKINATPLHYAAQNGMAEATDLLIERKASLEVVATGSQMQGTPLWAAVEAGQLLVAQRLLCAGADTECERDGLVPLALACRKESLSVAMAELLLRCGARPDVFPEPSYGQNRPGELMTFPSVGNVRLSAHSVYFHVATGMGKHGEATELRKQHPAHPCE